MMFSQSTDTPIIDFTILRQQFDETDTELLREIIEDFRQQRLELVAKMQASCDGGDLAAVAEAAHQLKGSLLILGAQIAANAANELEEHGRCGETEAAPAALQRLRQALNQLDPALDDLLARGLVGR
jgi:HPt (histidine-containing phosphotransfer) domain-containing protein